MNLTDRREILQHTANGVPPDVLAVWYPYPVWRIAQVARYGVKLRPEVIPRVHAMYEAGVPVTRIAKLMGCHRNSIHRVVSGRTWSAITPPTK